MGPFVLRKDMDITTKRDRDESSTLVWGTVWGACRKAERAAARPQVGFVLGDSGVTACRAARI